MNIAAERLEFAPPPTAGLLRALGLAVIAHALLLAALTWGVNWKRSADNPSVQAELWSDLPQEAAPRPIEVAPAPAPPVPDPVAPTATDSEIALEREKLRLKNEKQQAAQKLERDRRERQRMALEKQREQEEKLAQEKKKSELEARRKEAQRLLLEEQRLEAQRASNLRRAAGLAGSSAAGAATGSAAQAAGPSAGYGSRVSARVKPNIVFTEDLAGNPTAVVEVRAAPDGSIVSRKLLKSSGSKTWDEAVLRAIDKTQVLPRDVDGNVPPVLEISFRPRD